MSLESWGEFEKALLPWSEKALPNLQAKFVPKIQLRPIPFLMKESDIHSGINIYAW